MISEIVLSLTGANVVCGFAGAGTVEDIPVSELSWYAVDGKTAGAFTVTIVVAIVIVIPLVSIR